MGCWEEGKGERCATRRVLTSWGMAQEVLQVIEQQLDGFDSVDLSTAMVRLAKLQVKHKPFPCEHPQVLRLMRRTGTRLILLLCMLSGARKASTGPFISGGWKLQGCEVDVKLQR